MNELDILKEDLVNQELFKLNNSITVLGITLPVLEEDQAAFSKLIGAWTSARSLMTTEQSSAYLNEIVHIADANSVIHEMTRLSAYNLLLSYADIYYYKWVKTKEKVLAIKQSTSKEEAILAFNS